VLDWGLLGALILAAFALVGRWREGVEAAMSTLAT
jgi:hypothetical protein